MVFLGWKLTSLELHVPSYKKKIDKGFDFLRSGEKKIVSIFYLGRCEQVELSLGPKGDRFEIYTEGSLDISLHFGMEKCCRVVDLVNLNL